MQAVTTIAGMLRLSAAAIVAILAASTPVTAGIVLSQAVVDIAPAAPTAQDIEVWNDGKEVSYVVAEPAEIVSPGLPAEHRVAVEDPGVGGLLVTPQRMILQPGERRLVRVAAVAPRQATDRIYRVTIKPVAGPVTAKITALKLLVGYDVLVIFRPDAPAANLVGKRDAGALVLHNAGNTNAEVYDGKQCDPAKPTICTTLPARRVYPGEDWRVPLTGAGPVQYRVAVGSRSTVQQF